MNAEEPSNTATKHRWLAAKRIAWFLLIWAVLVFEVMAQGAFIPKTAQGWFVLVFVGPLAYVLIAAAVDSLFGAKK